MFLWEENWFLFDSRLNFNMPISAQNSRMFIKLHVHYVQHGVVYTQRSSYLSLRIQCLFSTLLPRFITSRHLVPSLTFQSVFSFVIALVFTTITCPNYPSIILDPDVNLTYENAQLLVGQPKNVLNPTWWKRCSAPPRPLPFNIALEMSLSMDSSSLLMRWPEYLECDYT